MANFTSYHIGQRSFGASLLEDGRVLATGGCDGDDATGVAVNGWDLLDYLPPNLNQESGVLPAVRAAHGQASLSGGDALISGGWTVAGTILATALRFDVATLTWSSVSSMNYARMHHEMVTLDDGLVLTIGGQTATKTLNFCELYEPVGDDWTKTGNMTYARASFGAIKLPDGRVLVVGGSGYNPTHSSTPADLASCEVYDPTSGLWSIIPPMASARNYPIVSYLSSENVVIVAGGGASTIETLDLSTMKWRKRRGTLATAHTISAGGMASDDTFLVSGGLLVDATEKKNYVVVPGDDVFWQAAGINGIHTIAEVPDGTHIKVYTREYDYNLNGNYMVAAEGAYITSMRAIAAPVGVPGPFSYDVKEGLAITDVATTTDEAFNRGGNYSSVHLTGVDPALDFPDEEGFIVFNFGFANQYGPVRYLGRLGEEDLLLDAALPFQQTVPVGSTVRLLTSREPFQPEPSALVGNFYATGTAAGRVAAQNTINDIVAAGKQILVTVLYPGDRGLGAEGYPQRGNYKLSDKVAVWGGDDLDQEIPAARADV